MSPNDALVALGSLVLGSLASLAIARHYFRRGTRRSTLTLDLRQVAYIDPSTVGVSVEMKVGRLRASNLVLLELVVMNGGPADIQVQNAHDATAHTLRPRIELPDGLRCLADPWCTADALPDRDVRIARSLEDGRQALHVHVHQLASKAEVTVRVLCAYGRESPRGDILPSALRFAPGFLPDVTVVGRGLLSKAPRLQVPMSARKAGI